MEIEIITTKKKLNKSLFTQIKYLKSSESLSNFECLGYVFGIDNSFNKVLLLQHKISKEYFRLPTTMVIYDKTQWKYIIGKWSKSYEIRFETELDCDTWFNIYTEYINNSQQIYI